jgi:hypothetical protein
MISYLAIPYTWNPDKSFEIANKVSAKLMQEGKVIFSPISHSHVIADHMDDSLRLSQSFWMDQDIPLLSVCGEIIIVVLGKIENGFKLIENSKGCVSERKRAIELGLNVIYYYYDDI